MTPRYGGVPILLEVAQFIAGYRIQSSVGAGSAAGNATAGLVGPVTAAGSASAAETHTDRPTVMYALLAGVDFLKSLIRPFPRVSFCSRCGPATRANARGAAQRQSSDPHRTLQSGGQSSVIVLGLTKSPGVAPKGLELRRLLGRRPNLRRIEVFYGGYSGRDDEGDAANSRGARHGRDGAYERSRAIDCRRGEL